MVVTGIQRRIGFDARVGEVRLMGTLRLPAAPSPVPAVILVHGSLEHDRDGNMLQHPDGRRLLPHPFLRMVADRFVAAGFAVAAWDKRGYAASSGSPGTYADQARDTAAVLDVIAAHPEVDAGRILVFGQSAGVYVASLLAEVDQRPCAYLLSGGLGSSFETMMRFNYERPVAYAARSPRHRRWVETHDRWGLLIGENLDTLIRAARRGDTEVPLSGRHTTHLHRIDADAWRPERRGAALVQAITTPVLVIHGERDLNVPVADAWVLAKAMHGAGNGDVATVVVPAVDHSFQETPDDLDARLRERMALTSFSRPYSEDYFAELVRFARRVV